ncbi:MAG TPA: hypothetical protein VK174_07720, partial [Chitinophagales bacterium]|nr:hypothetical protein [Chitinophagales bacterium]
HCSIREMPAEQLQEVNDYLAGFSFPNGTPVEQKNFQHYEGIKSQIAAWLQDSASRTKIKTDKLESLTDLESLVIEHIRNDKSQEEGKCAERIKNVKEKFAVLNAEIDPEKFRKMTDDIRRNDPFLFDNIAFQIESIPAEQLVLMANANFK